VLLDDRRHPPLRQVVGRLLARATAADFAIGRVRLAAVDLTEAELRRVERCRVLLGRLDAETLTAPPGGHSPAAAGAAHLLTLRGFLESGRVAVRTAGSTLWLPDFSVLDGLPPAPGFSGGAVCFVGAHYFARPYPTRGPALTCLLTGPESIASARERFEELWEIGYDVLPVILETLDALLAGAAAMPP
jgi:hypothetical protein